MGVETGIVSFGDLSALEIDHVLVDKLYWKLEEYEAFREDITFVICDVLEHLQESDLDLNNIVPASELYGEHLLESKILLFEQMAKEELIELYGVDGNSVRLKFTDSFLKSMADRLKNIKNGVTPNSSNNDCGDNKKPDDPRKLHVVRKLNTTGETCPRQAHRRIGG